MKYAIVKHKKSYALSVTIAGEYTGLVKGLPKRIIERVCEAQDLAVLTNTDWVRASKGVAKLMKEYKQMLEQRKVVGFKPVLHTTAPTPVNKRFYWKMHSTRGKQVYGTVAAQRNRKHDELRKAHNDSIARGLKR